MSISTRAASGALSVDKLLGEAFKHVKEVSDNLDSIRAIAEVVDTLPNTVADILATRDAMFADHIAILVAGLNNYVVTIVEGIATSEIGEYFVSDELGSIRVYRRIALSPYYEDQGDLIANAIYTIIGRTTSRLISDIIGLQAALDGKSAVGHTHSFASIPGLEDELDSKLTQSLLQAPNQTYSGFSFRVLDFDRTDHIHAYSLGDPLTSKSKFSFKTANGSGGSHEFVLDGDGNIISSNSIFVENGSFEVWHENNFDPFNYTSKAELAVAIAELEAGAVDLAPIIASINAKADIAHTHTIANVTGLQSALDGKQAVGSYALSTDLATLSSTVLGALSAKLDIANFTWGNLAGVPTSFTPATHTHIISQITGLQAALDSKQATGAYLVAADLTWANISGKPATFAPSAHTHVIGDVTGLQSALDGKAATAHSHAIADVTGLQTALDGKQAAGSYAAASHGHVIADVTGLQTALDGKAATSHTHPYLPLTGGSLSGILNANGNIWVTSVGYNPNGDKFTYQTVDGANYGMTAAAPTGWGGNLGLFLSGYGGIAFFTNGQRRAEIDIFGRTIFGDLGNDSVFRAGKAGIADIRVGFDNTSNNYYDANYHYLRNLAGTNQMVIGGGQVHISRNRFYAGDIIASRGTSGVIYLNDAEDKYLYWDGTQYILPGGTVNVNGVDVLASLATKFNNTGGTINGSVTNISTSFNLQGGGNASGLTCYHSFKDSAGVERGWLGFGEGNTRFRVRNSIGNIMIHALTIDLYNDNTGYGTKISNPDGYVEIGPLNAGYCHFQTDRPAFYFNKAVQIDGVITRYGQGAVLHHNNNSLASGSVTVSTASPSGGADGDIWIKVP